MLKFSSALAIGFLGSMALGVALPSWAYAQTPSITFIPHLATYKLTLAKSTGEKAPADANGLISYDFSGSACAGFKTVFRQITELEPPEGDSRISKMQSTTVESGDAKQFSFDTQSTLNDTPADTISGKASKASDGSVSLDLKQPSTDHIDVKTAVLFPTEHLRTIIESAEAGKKILAVSVFDGSDTGKKVYNTLSIIGAPITTPAPEKAAGDDSLKNTRRWPVTISYFEQGQEDAQPNYVLSFELYENGVSRALKIDYGNFVLAGELTDFKPQTAKPCDK